MLDNAVYHLSISLSFQKYSQSKSRIVVKRTKFWTFFAFPNFKGAVPVKVVCLHALTPRLAARQVAKFYEATPFRSKVLAAKTLHIKPILDPL